MPSPATDVHVEIVAAVDAYRVDANVAHLLDRIELESELEVNSAFARFKELADLATTHWDLVIEGLSETDIVRRMTILISAWSGGI